MDKPWIAELSQGCWLAPWEGDPGRTVVKDNAQRYATEGAAKVALTRARKRYRFRSIKGRAVLALAAGGEG